MRVLPFCAVALSLSCLAWAGPDERGGRGGGRVTFFEHADFRGGAITVDVGDQLVDLSRVVFSNGVPANDAISSIRVEGDVEVVLCRDARFRGADVRISRSVRNLARERLRDEEDHHGELDQSRNWNDEISSVRVERDRDRGRHSPGPSRPDYRQVDRVIERAYREILLRAPDEGGLRLYRRLMLDEGWSEPKVRDGIRRSDEYREVVTRIVAKAYRDVLGREPDPEGLRGYSEHMLKHRWTDEDVRRALRGSEEYKHRSR